MDRDAVDHDSYDFLLSFGCLSYSILRIITVLIIDLTCWRCYYPERDVRQFSRGQKAQIADVTLNVACAHEKRVDFSTDKFNCTDSNNLNRTGKAYEQGTRDSVASCFVCIARPIFCGGDRNCHIFLL